MKIDECCTAKFISFFNARCNVNIFWSKSKCREQYCSLSQELGPALHQPMHALVVFELAGGGPVTAVHPPLPAVTHRLQLDDCSFSCRSKHKKHQSESMEITRKMKTRLLKDFFIL